MFTSRFVACSIQAKRDLFDIWISPLQKDLTLGCVERLTHQRSNPFRFSLFKNKIFGGFGVEETVLSFMRHEHYPTTKGYNCLRKNVRILKYLVSDG